MDLISIGIPTYNRAGSLKRTLELLQSQTYKNLEIIISDNASSDDTGKICRQMTAKDQRIKYFKQAANVGMINNYQYVLRMSRGKYFMWAADDDWWDPTFIEELHRGLSSRPHHGAAMSSVRREYDDHALHSIISFAEKGDVTEMEYAELFKFMVWGKPVHIFLYGLFRTELLKKVLRRPFPTCAAGDRVLMGEFSLITHFYSSPKILFTKTIYRSPLNVRYGAEAFGQNWQEKTKRIKYAQTFLPRVLFSTFIPFRRKIQVIPLLILMLTRTFRYLLRDIFKK